MPGKKPERSWKNRGGTESARIHPAEKGAGAGNNPGEGPEICGRERHNTELARLEAEKAEERRRNACATAERRRRKLEKLQATGGTAGQKH